ncbi:MAG: hypothetical protein IT181_04310, partial [Acidobacteria bacterium]|nr:hypothetical protein [Acidobacteriota bacterium]
SIAVDVTEVAAVNGATVPGGLAGRTVLNPDIENPDIENPDIENPDIENPDIENVVVANPDIENLGVANPDIENPDIENPDIENPDIENPDIENGAMADVTWTVSNIGNTTSAFNVNLFLANAGVPAGVKTQLVVYKTYKTPVLDPNGCDLRTETRNLVMFNVPNPNFITPGEALPTQNDPSDSNATLWLAPGEVGRVTLRVFDDDTSNNLIIQTPKGPRSIDPAFNPATTVTVGIAGQGVDILDPPGSTRPPVVTTTGTNLVFLQQPSSITPGATIAPPVSVRVYDNAGAPLPGVLVSVTLENAPLGAVLSGTTTAAADVNGIATFSGLSVNVAGTGLGLRASATSPGVVAAGSSAPFDVVQPTTPALVDITNYSAIVDGSPKAVTVTTTPAGLATAVTYTASPAPPSAVGAYLVQATVTEPAYIGAAAAVQTIASTFSVGGKGGGPFPLSGALGCQPGVFATGMRPSTTPYYGLLGTQVLCGDGNHPPRVSGPVPNAWGQTYSEADATCAPGEIVVGLHGQIAAPFGFPVVATMGPRCQSPLGGAITDVPALGAPSAGTPYSLTCNPGEAMTGIVGGIGEVMDGVALVCAAVPGPPPTPTITSFSPAAQVSPFQMLTINGTNLPATSLNEVVFNQGGPDIPAQYMWSGSPTRAIVRLPSTLAIGALTTVRLKNPADTVSTAAVPLNITVTPGTPVLSGVWASCAGGPITSIIPGAPFAISGQGIDTSNTTIVWTRIGVVGAPALTQSFLSTTAGPGGEVCSYPTTPTAPGSNIGAPALTSGNWLVTIRHQGIFGTSADSNGIVITVP